MARFTLTIDCDNAAFEDDREHEIARILVALGSRMMERGILPGPIVHDLNGNRVGEWRISEGEG